MTDNNISVSLPYYVRVTDGTSVSYGGSQQWFADPSGKSGSFRPFLFLKKHLSRNAALRSGGCGLVAVCDFMLYYCRKHHIAMKDMPASFREAPSQPIDRTEYLKYLRHKSRTVYPVLPYLGSFSFQAQLILNLFLKKARSGKRLRFLWKNTKKERLRTVERSLSAGDPLILLLSRPLNPIGMRGVDFYVISGEEAVLKVKHVSGHFVTVTGLTEHKGVLYLTVSSWGRKYYIRMKDLDRYILLHGTPLLSGLYYLR